MSFFHKNKRRFFHGYRRSHFVALFLFCIFVATTATTIIANVRAQDAPVKMVEFYSDQTDYENETPGSWKVTKSAEWIGAGRARITFEVTSIPKYFTKYVR